ncbi:MAG: hypothetical protein IJG68_04450 [Bacilli bacterium]|nr:hypothetical protein [Bacilli bacterium]
MHIQTKDDQYLEIQQMKDLISIDYQDLFITTSKEKVRILPGFLAFYGNGKSLFLTSRDPYFEVFVKRLKEVYQEEKDNIVREEIMGSKGILIDDFAKQLLLSGELECTSNWYQYYQGKDGYQDSLFFEEDQVAAFFPIIEYHLRESSKMWNQTIGNMKLSSGSNGIYSIDTTINNQNMICPILFSKKNSQNYLITIGNVFEKALPIIMEIQFTMNGIVVLNRIAEYDYSDYYQYDFDKEYPTLHRCVSVGDKLKHYSNEHLEKVDDFHLPLLEIDQSPSHPKWYLLPWNSMMGIEEENEKVLEDKQILSRKLFYYCPSKTHLSFKELGTKHSSHMVSNQEECDEVIIDSIVKDCVGLKQDNHILLETSFDSLGTTGFYKKELSGKYYYHLSLICEWNELNKNNIQLIERKNGLEEKVDLLDVKKYIKK